MMKMEKKEKKIERMKEKCKNENGKERKKKKNENENEMEKKETNKSKFFKIHFFLFMSVSILNSLSIGLARKIDIALLSSKLSLCLQKYNCLIIRQEIKTRLIEINLIFQILCKILCNISFLQPCARKHRYYVTCFIKEMQRHRKCYHYDNRSTTRNSKT